MGLDKMSPLQDKKHAGSLEYLCTNISAYGISCILFVFSQAIFLFYD